jgi:hypothetical protein
MFRKVFPSIIRSLRLYIQHQVYVIATEHIWNIPDAVCTALDSWWWTERPSETCRVLFQNKINLRYYASGRFYYRNIVLCTVLQTSKLPLCCYISQTVLMSYTKYCSPTAIPFYYTQDTLKLFETVHIWNCGRCSITKDIINHAQKHYVKQVFFFVFVFVLFKLIFICWRLLLPCTSNGTLVRHYVAEYMAEVPDNNYSSRGKLRSFMLLLR